MTNSGGTGSTTQDMKMSTAVCVLWRHSTFTYQATTPSLGCHKLLSLEFYGTFSTNRQYHAIEVGNVIT